MNRRKFIGIIGVGAIGITAGSVIVFSDFEKAIKGVIKGEANKLQLKISDKEIDLFIEGARQLALWDSYSVRKIETIKWSFHIDKLGLSFLLWNRYQWYKQEIMQQFLFSSSFFYDGMDESKPIRYLRIYDPYTTPCCNPFSNLYCSE